MNRKTVEERARMIHLLCEGNSLRSVSRISDVTVNTVVNLLVNVGKACQVYQNTHLRNLPCKNIQVDEIWSFVFSSKKNTSERNKGKFGDIWTWTSLCADTRLVPCWTIGLRDTDTCQEFIDNLYTRIDHRIQLTSDGLRLYVDAVDNCYGKDIDFGMLVKRYKEHKKNMLSRYEGSSKDVITGNPDKSKISTSYVERQNLTMRMNIKRFGRRTNAFSKKIENHRHAIALHFMAYNFVNIQKSLRVTPAMAVGVTEKVWDYRDIAMLCESTPASEDTRVHL